MTIAITGPLLTLFVGFLVKKIVDAVVNLVPAKLNSLVVLLVAQFVGVGAGLLLRASDFANVIALNDTTTLASVNTASAVIYGMILGGLASGFNDVLAAMDGTRSSMNSSVTQPNAALAARNDIPLPPAGQ